MPEISFSKDISPISATSDESLMQALISGGRPVGSSCGGDGVCTKCLIEIISGVENLSPASDRENELRTQHGFPKNFRVSCQTKILGNITVDAPYW